MSELQRALHLLLARCHLALAGVRLLTDEEWSLLEDLHTWYRRHRRQDQLSDFSAKYRGI